MRLKVQEQMPSLSEVFSFNSKLVRLKGSDKKVDYLRIVKFQFQTGAIKRQGACTLRMTLSSFNSKLVRLKEGDLGEPPHELLWFQFQTGAIKSADRLAELTGVSAVSIPNWCD